VQVDPPPGERGVQLGRAEVPGKPHSDARRLQSWEQQVAVDTEGVDFERLEAPQQVSARGPPAAYGLVDDERQPGEITGVAKTRIRDAVLDHPGRPRAAVPEQIVEVGDMDDRDPVCIGKRMPRVGDVRLWCVVLEEDRRQVYTRCTAEQPPASRNLFQPL
jgi:hypothetical protein